MPDPIATLLFAAAQTLEDEIARKKIELAAEEQKLDKVRRAVDAHDTPDSIKITGHPDIFEATVPCDMYFNCKGKPKKFRGRAQRLYDGAAYVWFEDGECMAVDSEELIHLAECTHTKSCLRGDNHRGRCSTLSKIIRKS
jgi:hypothetical protein